MNARKYELILAITLVALSGCDNKLKNEPQPPQIFKEELRALDKAKGLGDAIGKQAEEQRKQTEEATK